MHRWGDEWEYWADLDAAVETCQDLADEAGLPTLQIKEKWGGLRWYVDHDGTDEFNEKYRKVYEQLVEQYPHIATEILADADWGELLLGIVDPKDCEHTHTMYDGKRTWCPVCGQDKHKLGTV